MNTYDILKKSYEKFVEKVNQTKNAASFSRYSMEIKLLGKMKEYAQKFGLSKEIAQIEIAENNARKSLKDMGITLK